MPLLGKGMGWLGYVYALNGEREKAERILDGDMSGKLQPVDKVFIYTGLGEYDKAVDWLEKAYEEKDSYVAYIAVFPEFDPLRTHPRFRALVKKMNLPAE